MCNGINLRSVYYGTGKVDDNLGFFLSFCITMISALSGNLNIRGNINTEDKALGTSPRPSISRQGDRGHIWFEVDERFLSRRNVLIAPNYHMKKVSVVVCSANFNCLNDL